MTHQQPTTGRRAVRAGDGDGSLAELVWRAVLVVELCLLVALGLGAGVGVLLSDLLLTLVDGISGR